MAVTEQNLVVAEINNYPEEKFNRLFPCTLTELSPLHKVMVNLVKINPDPSGGDVYKQGSGLALTKISCLKLMTAANAVMEESKQIFPRACQRCMQVAQATKQAPQCGSCPSREDVAYQVSILVPEPSGGHRRYVATKEVSKAQFVTKNGGASKAPVEHMPAQCETKALLRALRAGLGIKGVYSAIELQKPFAVAVVVLNAHDPELKKALIESYAQSRNALFSPRTAPQLAAPAATQALLPGETTGDTTVILPDVEDDDDSPPSLGDDAPNFGGDLFGGGETDREPGEDFITCEGCAMIVEEFTDEKGKHWTPEEMADWTRENLGRIFCKTCAGKEMRSRLAKQQKK